MKKLLFLSALITIASLQASQLNPSHSDSESEADDGMCYSKIRIPSTNRAQPHKIQIGDSIFVTLIVNQSPEDNNGNLDAVTPAPDTTQ